MANYKAIPCDTTGIKKDIRIACVCTWWNESYIQELLGKNIGFLEDQGFDNISVFQVPGSLELPGFATQIIADYDIVILFGVIIKGKTMHYEFISQAIFNGIVELSMKHPQKALITGILTVEDESLLEERISDNFARSALNLWQEKQK